MNKVKWLSSNQIAIEPPKRPKKVSGTKFGAILGVNPWSDPFEQWCAITRTWEKPYEETIYTAAGKVIEGKQANYMEKSYGMNLIRPTDIYGADPFKATYGDFFKDNKLFSGMWDFLQKGEDEKPCAVLEMKTTKRAEDWKDGSIPPQYAHQAALYAWLLGLDNVIMVCSFLSPSDYDHPEAYVPSVKNTITVEFKVSERYPDFADKVKQVEKWWAQYVETGVSPIYDEKKDAEILAALRTTTVEPDHDFDALVAEAESLRAYLDAQKAALAERTKRLEALQEIIKQHGMEAFGEGDTHAEIRGTHYVWTVAKSETKSIDKDALEADGLLSKYEVAKPKYVMTVKENKANG